MTGCIHYRCQNVHRCRDIGMCSLALEADGEKLRQMTGEDHGPWFDHDYSPQEFQERRGYAANTPLTDEERRRWRLP